MYQGVWARSLTTSCERCEISSKQLAQQATTLKVVSQENYNTWAHSSSPTRMHGLHTLERYNRGGIGFITAMSKAPTYLVAQTSSRWR